MTGVAVPLGLHVCRPGCREHVDMAPGARVAAGLAALAALVNDALRMSVTDRSGPLPAAVAGSVDATPATTPGTALGHRPGSLRPRPGPGRPAGPAGGGPVPDDGTHVDPAPGEPAEGQSADGPT